MSTTAPKSPHELFQHPTLGTVARHVNAVGCNLLMLQAPEADARMWAKRMVEDAEALARHARVLLEQVS